MRHEEGLTHVLFIAHTKNRSSPKVLQRQIRLHGRSPKGSPHLLLLVPFKITPTKH